VRILRYPVTVIGDDSVRFRHWRRRREGFTEEAGPISQETLVYRGVFKNRRFEPCEILNPQEIGDSENRLASGSIFA
jgi:hypothetical protein